MPDQQVIQLKQLRFEYSKQFTELLEDFSKTHILDDRKTFKTNWKSWKEKHQNIYDDEINKIQNAGYNGCPHAKIFESVRYYYRKKHLKIENNQPKQNKTKQKLTGLSKTIKNAMDNHMKRIILQNNNINNNTDNIDLSPAATFTDFCKTNIADLTLEIYRLKKITNAQLDAVEIEIKFKKAYKNRFYTFLQSIH
jgi:hypothetical protein